MFCKLRNLEFQLVDQEDPREQHFFISRYYSTCVIIVNLYLLRLLNIGIHLFQSSKVKSEFVPACLWNPCPYPRPISIYTCKCLHLYSLELNSVWRKIRRRSDRFWQRSKKTEVAPEDRFEDRLEEILGSKQCSPATEARHRGRNDTELSPTISRTLKEDLADIIRAQLRQKVSPSRQIRRMIVGDPGRHQK